MRRNILEKKNIREITKELDRIIQKTGTLAVLDDEPFLEKFIALLNKISQGSWAYLSPAFFEYYLFKLVSKYPKLDRKVKYILMYGASTSTSTNFFEWTNSPSNKPIQEKPQLSPLQMLNTSYQSILKDKYAKPC